MPDDSPVQALALVLVDFRTARPPGATGLQGTTCDGIQKGDGTDYGESELDYVNLGMSGHVRSVGREFFVGTEGRMRVGPLRPVDRVGRHFQPAERPFPFLPPRSSPVFGQGIPG